MSALHHLSMYACLSLLLLRPFDLLIIVNWSAGSTATDHVTASAKLMLATVIINSLILILFMRRTNISIFMLRVLKLLRFHNPNSPKFTSRFHSAFESDTLAALPLIDMINTIILFLPGSNYFS